MAKETIEQLAKALAETLPEGVRAVRDDLEKNFKSVLTSGISKMDLVTREDFEVQRAVLARTREKLAVLEGRLADLEAPAAKTAKKKTSKKKVARKKAAKKKAAKKKAG